MTHSAILVLEHALEGVQRDMDFHKARLEALSKDLSNLANALAMVRKRVKQS